MARTYYTVIPPRRRWALAAASGLTTLALSAGLGNPWSAGFFARLVTEQSLRGFAVLFHALTLFHWSLTPAGMAEFGGSGQTGRYAGALTLDLGWPLLVFLGVRLLAGGLAPRRGGFSLLISTWGLTAFVGALAAIAAGTTDHLVGGAAAMKVYPGAIDPGFPGLANLLTTLTATMVLLSLALGWLPAIAAALGYSVRRSVDRADEDYLETGEETTIVDVGNRPVVVGAAAMDRETLNLAALEALRNARYDDRYEIDPVGREDRGLMDPRTSTFFGEGQY